MQAREANLRNVFLYFLLEFAVLELSSGLLLAQEPQRDLLSELDRLDRETVIRAVVERNPTIEAARQAWEAAREREPQLTSLDDPRVSRPTPATGSFLFRLRAGRPPSWRTGRSTFHS